MTHRTATTPPTAARPATLLVADWMTRGPVVVAPSTSVLNARRLLATYGIRHLPVVDAGVLVGIVSERDVRPADPTVAWALATLRSDLVAGRYRAVSTLMSGPVHVARPGDTVDEAAGRMLELRVGALPVVDGRRLVGMLSIVDAVRALLASRGTIGGRAAASGAAAPEERGTEQERSRDE